MNTEKLQNRNSHQKREGQGRREYKDTAFKQKKKGILHLIYEHYRVAPADEEKLVVMK